jgi:hypothetical protein
MNKVLTGLVSGLFVILAFVSEAHATLVPLLGWGYSLGYGADRALGVIPPGASPLGNDEWSIWWDPPASVIDGRVTFKYDPNLITVHPERSGFIGEFSDNPAINMPFNPSGVYPPFDMSTLPGPRPGMVFDLFVGPDTVILTFDLSANPVTVPEDAGPINFFGLAITTTVPLVGFKIEDTNTGHFHEVGSFLDQSQTFMHCSDVLRGVYNCGETTSPSRGFGLTAIPEPSTYLLFGTGVLVLLGFGWRPRWSKSIALARCSLPISYRSAAFARRNDLECGSKQSAPRRRLTAWITYWRLILSCRFDSVAQY